jgi:hypothetical protein
MKILRIIFFIIALVFTFASCSEYDQKIEIKDLNKQQIITLNKESNQSNIHSIRIRGIGKIDGKANIFLLLNQKPYKAEELTDKVKFSWGGDWYSNSAELMYVPISVKSGTLSIEYKFLDIK